MRSVRCHRLDPTYSRSEQRATRPPPPCAPTPQGPSAPSSKTLTRPGLRGACGSSAPGSLATDSGLDFHSDWSPGSSCVSGSARSFCPFWFATSQSARTGLPRLGPLLRLPPPPVARGEGGDTDWGGGKGGGEARRCPLSPAPLPGAGRRRGRARPAAALDVLPEGTAAVPAARRRLPVQRATGHVHADAPPRGLARHPLLRGLHIPVVRPPGPSWEQAG